MNSNASHHSNVPPGWNHNPSEWPERLPMLLLALLGIGIATYLALDQLRVVPRVWEPFFGDGSERVLHSSLSRWLPVPDAALGAFGYVVEFVLGLIGGRQRWRTLPWVAAAFGLVAAGMALAGIILVICQPVLAGSWCTLCLCSALISVVLGSLASRELTASLEELKRRHKETPHGLRPGTA